eukprot:CAMPEP_0168575296 /NCGR_PEP_ID=MMETSP0413-20121227/19580_1 /TAXON_ID=136452 /ORGANISM="Filamoeba nolandi, Strain NC-AS-23-1" /LENGTH=646 /DNA_ID=CAMNT_0008608779 /DNA_START=245 /DNA_END=2185 /DNA_ORIENTATION=-
MQIIIETIAKELSLGTLPMYSLCKLVLFETASDFQFLPEIQKESNTFGTLLIQLPSIYQGGQLVVSHNSQHQCAFDFTEDPFSISYAAFYQQCEHYFKPVTCGYKLCLVFNLLTTTPLTVSPFLVNPSTESTIILLLQKWREHATTSPHALKKFGFAFQTRYAEPLNFSQLNDSDRYRCNILRSACKSAGFSMYLVMMQITEKGAAIVKGYSKDSSGKRIPNWTMGEVFECVIRLDNWINLDDKPEQFGMIEMKYDEFFPLDFTQNMEPDISSTEESGTMENWYKRAGLVIWPEENDITINVKNTRQCINMLHNWVTQYSQTQDKKLRLKCVYTISALLLNENLDIDEFSRIAIYAVSLGEVVPVKQFLSKFLPFMQATAFGLKEQIFLKSCKVFGLKAMSEVGQAVLLGNLNGAVNMVATLAQQVVTPDTESNNNNNNTPSISLEDISQLIEVLFKRVHVDVDLSSLKKHILLLDFASAQLQKEFLDTVSKFHVLFVKDKLAPALVDLGESGYKPSNPTFLALVSYCAQTYSVCIGKCPEVPAVKLVSPCDCADCTTAVEFLKNPTQKELQFKLMFQSEATHLEQTLKSMKAEAVMKQQGGNWACQKVEPKDPKMLLYKQWVTNFQTLERLNFMLGVNPSQSTEK